MPNSELSNRSLQEIRRIVREEFERAVRAELKQLFSSRATSDAAAIRAGAVETIGAAAPNTNGNGEHGKLRESVEQREHRATVAEIEADLLDLGRSDEQMQKWFADEYRTNLLWRKAGIAALREVAAKTRTWKQTAAKKAARQ